MYPPPEGPSETPEQATELDDTFLSSDPFGYFTARIGMIHAWALAAPIAQDDVGQHSDGESTDGAASTVGRPDFLGVIHGVMRNEPPPQLPQMVVTAQVAVDAFALRHHLAEALLRLLVACVEDGEPKPDDREPGSAVSMWARLTDDKAFSINDLVAGAVRAGKELPDDGLARLVLPPDVALDETTLPLAERLVEVCADWLEHAVALLRPSGLDTTTAHNKVKHGLAIRGRSDLRVAFTTVGPREDGNIDLSAFDPNVSVDVFDRPVLEFLSRPSRKQGLELTQLRLDYRELLSEASMMAFVHGALFHVAARRHFVGRVVPHGLKVPEHPGFVGESPKPNHAGHQVGMRFPITQPLGGGSARPAGVGHPDGSFQTLSFTGKRVSGRVVDESQPDVPKKPTEGAQEDGAGEKGDRESGT